MRIYLLAIIISSLCLLQGVALSQAPNNTGSDNNSRKGSLLEVGPQDTVKEQIYTTAIDFYHLRHTITDSMDFQTHQYDQTRRELIHYGTLGNLGSAHRPQIFSPSRTKGLDFGQHQYDLYKRRFGEFKFYDSESTITEFNYSQGFTQRDGILQARFGKNFAQGIKLSIDYQRINQTGQYQNQRSKNTVLGVGVWYDAPSGFYDGLFHYSSNSIVTQDNGGVLSYRDVDTLPDPITVPVNLTSALTTQRERILSVQNHFHLYNKRDSVQKPFLIDLIHTGQYKNGLIKFQDDAIPLNIEYYDDFLTDDRGVRHYLFYRTFDNRLDAQLRFRGENKNEVAKHLLRVGLQYRHTNLEQEPLERKIDEVFLNASGRLSITRSLDLRAHGFLAILGQTGDFNLEGRLRYKLAKLGDLTAHAGAYQRSANILEQNLYVTTVPIWNNDFNKPIYSHLGLEAKLTALRLHVYGGLQVVGNYIYFDEERKPIQVSEAQDIWQFIARKELSLNKVGLMGTVAFQASPEFLGLPTWIGEIQLYYSDLWFKGNMEVRTGIDLRITNAYDGVSYFPVTGQFHLNEQFKIDQYPAMDVFFDFQVRKSFRAFFKVENLSAVFIDDVYANIAGYPQFGTYFRFGIWMKLFN